MIFDNTSGIDCHYKEVAAQVYVACETELIAFGLNGPGYQIVNASKSALYATVKDHWRAPIFRLIVPGSSGVQHEFKIPITGGEIFEIRRVQ